MVNLYGKTDCIQCTLTERKLKDMGIPYNKINVMEDEQALAKLKDLGYQGVPVVENNGSYFQGFKPSELMKLASNE